ncbi:MAG TPA: LEA type 2 family protein [Kofleriaceae bacterium]|jgi:LEA14-like dessication related protein|nr:LEA type 2 family protein [Kofleriaceae bacterium]
MRLRLLAVAGLALFLSGCSLFMRSIEKPTAQVRGVSVTSAALIGVKGELSLDVSNPNAFGVPLQSIDWQLSVGGSRAATGQVELSQTIPAKGVAPVTTSLTILAGDAAALGIVLANGARNYELAARLTFSTKIGPLTVDVRHTGTLGGTGGVLGQARALGL